VPWLSFRQSWAAGRKDVMAHRKRFRPSRVATSWDAIAAWYDGWVGHQGSRYHREVAIPALLELLQPRAGERILDIGCGQGVLAPYLAAHGASYTGLDASARLIALARRRHANSGKFLVADAAGLAQVPTLRPSSFDACVFLLSIQDMAPLSEIIASAARMLNEKGRLVLLLPHPAFQVPRQSGWGWDERRKLRYRRIDRYLSPLAVPTGRDERRLLRRFHRPLGDYVSALGASGLVVRKLIEVPGHWANAPPEQRVAAERALSEFPLFLGLLALRTPN
jgi:SAM-dependent methyltransferase